MKVQTKIFLLLLAVALSMLFALHLWRIMDIKSTATLQSEIKKDKAQSFDKIVELREKSLATLAFDYTYWGEMVDFVRSGDRLWAVENLNPALETFKVNSVWVYDTSFRLVYSVNNLGVKEWTEIPADKASLNNLMAKKPFPHFFIKTDRGLIEIEGAPIQPSADLKRETPALGYFFAGRLWDDQYLKELSDLSGNSVSLVPVGTNPPAPRKNQPGEIYFTRELAGMKGEAVALVMVNYLSPALQRLEQISRNSFYQYLLFASIILVVIFVSLYYWVNNPLALISSALRHKSTYGLENITTQNDEFGQLARLVHDWEQGGEKLKESEAKYRSLFEQSKDAIFINSRKGGLLDINQSGLDLFGYSREDLAKIRIRDLYADFSDFERLRGEILEKGSVRDLEARFKRKDGSVIDCLITAAARKAEDGSVLGYHGVIRDITEKKESETRIIMAADEWRKTVDSIPEIIMHVNKQQLVTRANHEASRKLGMGFREMIGKSYYKLIYKSDTPVEYCPLMKTLIDGKDHSEEIHIDALNGDFISSSTPLFDNEGRLTGAVLVLRDVTERNLMEKELLRAHKLDSLGILAGGIAHDFNNILSGILMNISFAKILASKGQQATDILTEAEAATLRARDLTQQLLTFAKGGAPVLETSSIADLLRESATFALRGSNVTCDLKISGDLWPVDVDKGQMSQVIHNLVINADQAMPRGGRITVSADNLVLKEGHGKPLGNGEFIKITISDQGVGISNENISKIFDPYFTTKKKGSGLGLATTYSIIKKHHGQIFVESQVGAGTTFEIYLPASKDMGAKEGQKEHDVFLARAKILIMDDEDVFRESVGKILEILGCEVKTSKDGAEAVELYRQSKDSGKKFDIVILDLTVPGGMGGKEAIAALIEIDPGVKAVVASGYSNDPVMANYKKFGFKEAIVKPFELGTLKKVLYKLMM